MNTPKKHATGWLALTAALLGLFLGGCFPEPTPWKPSPESEILDELIGILTATAPPMEAQTPSAGGTVYPTIGPADSSAESDSTPRSEFITYIIQPNDTLAEIAIEFDVDLGQLMAVNDIADPDLLFVGQELQIPPNVPLPPGPDLIILPDSELVYSPGNMDFDVEGFIKQYGGALASHVEEVNDEDTPGPQIVQMVATEYSVNPRLLIAVLEYRTRYLTRTDKPGDVDRLYPVGFYDPQYEGLYRQLSWAANSLNYGYYAWKVGGVAGWSFTDGQLVAIASSLNPGTAGIQYLMANLLPYEEWETAVSTNGFVLTYLQLFGNPYDYLYDPILPLDLAQPALELPFERGTTWSFTGGPHSSWGWGSAWGALDFAPPGEPIGCIISTDWVTAAVDGLVTRSEWGVVVQDLDGDGSEQTGWTILYLHVDSYERVEAGVTLHTGDRIGHPSCEGGYSYGSHLHIARRYNGEWISADGAIPFNLSGWISEGTGIPYDGYLKRDGQIVTAWDEYVAENQIHH